MVKVKDIIDLISCNVQIVKANNIVIGIDFSLNTEGSISNVLSESLLNEEVQFIECERDKAILLLGGEK